MNQQSLPEGWIRAGSNPAEYEMGVDPTTTYEGGVAAYVKARSAASEGFATLMQNFKADAYRGKRLRFAANARSVAVEKWAGLWMRVDGAQQKGIQFDNMQDRPITGTTEWTHYEVVLDVPPESELVAFGLLVAGPGQVWMANLAVDTVSLDVPSTHMKTEETLSDHPVNLAFTEHKEEAPADASS